MSREESKAEVKGTHWTLLYKTRDVLIPFTD